MEYQQCLRSYKAKVKRKRGKIGLPTVFFRVTLWLNARLHKVTFYNLEHNAHGGYMPNPNLKHERLTYAKCNKCARHMVSEPVNLSVMSTRSHLAESGIQVTQPVSRGHCSRNRCPTRPPQIFIGRRLKRIGRSRAANSSAMLLRIYRRWCRFSRFMTDFKALPAAPFRTDRQISLWGSGKCDLKLVCDSKVCPAISLR